MLETVTSNTGEIILQELTGEAMIYNNLMVAPFGTRGQAFSSEPTGDGEVVLANNLAVGGIVINGREPEQMENIFVTEDRQSFPQFAQAQDSVFFQTFAFSSVDDFKQFYGLRATSPALNAGANDLAPATDLNGVARPIDAIVDIGAYEGAVEGVGPLPEDQRLRAFALSTPTSLMVDGDKDGLYTGQTEQITKLIAGSTTNSADLSAQWTAAYNDRALYILVDVRDDSLRGPGDNPAGADGIELYFDADNAAGDTLDADDRRFIVSYGDNNRIVNATDEDVAGTEVAVVDNAAGYSVEVAIPWELLDVTPADSLIIGFDVQVIDTDTNRDSTEATLAWAASDTLARTNPSRLGELMLLEVEAPPTIQGTTDSIVIDGLADEAYEGVTVYDLVNQVQPGIENTEDFRADWRALWDTSGLYVFITVVDDVLINDSQNWYEDDGVEIYIDAENDKATSYDANDHQIVVAYDSMMDTIYDTKGNLGTGARSAIAATDSGYTVEAYIPWTALSISPSVGTFLGFDVHGIDDDAGEGGNDGKLAWFTTIDESFKNPSLFGTVILGDLSTSVRNLQPAGDWLSISPNPTQGALRYQFDVLRQGNLTLHDFQGRLLQSRRVSGSSGELQLGNLPNGVYLLTVRDGKEWARQRIVVQH